MAKRDFKRVLVISDLQCGHIFGLTHPDFDAEPSRRKSDLYAAYKARRICWSWFITTVNELRPIDLLIVNGDAIDGRQEKQGGAELIVTTRDEQTGMAEAAIETISAPFVRMSFGTPYHTGRLEDWETLIAKHIKADKIGDHDQIKINGCILDYKHHVGIGALSHLQFTTPAKERAKNVDWFLEDGFSLADIYIRSHVHRYLHLGTNDWTILVTPGLQWYGGKYGSRMVGRKVDFGVLSIDITSKHDYSWSPHLCREPRLAANLKSI